MSLTAVTWAAASKFPRAAGFSKTLTVYAQPKYPHVPRIRAIACITSMFVCCKAPARGLGRASKSVRSLRFSSQTARTESYNSTDRGQLSRFDDTAHGPKSSVTPFSTNTLHRTAHARKQYSPAKERQRANAMRGTSSSSSIRRCTRRVTIRRLRRPSQMCYTASGVRRERA
jgi:hypothetical protein